jgi:hypothetical protein
MAKKLAMIFGVVFILVGILGFLNNPIFNVFAVDTLHNIVHIILGIILVAGSRKANPTAAAMSMRTVGIIYLLLAVLGFIFVPSETDKLLGIVTMNGADNWLHVVLGVVLLIVGMSAGKSAMQKPAGPAMPGNSQM